MKIANIDPNDPKMWLMIILKVTKNQGFTFSLEDTVFEKPQGGSNWPPPLAVLVLKQKNDIKDKNIQNNVS